MGMAGPAIQAGGIAWEVTHLLTGHVHSTIDARHLLFEPAVLVIVVGFLVSLVCVPVAIEVAQASPQELTMPALGAEPTEHENRRSRRLALK
jgi:hypothetical protein